MRNSRARVTKGNNISLLVEKGILIDIAKIIDEYSQKLPKKTGSQRRKEKEIFIKKHIEAGTYCPFIETVDYRVLYRWFRIYEKELCYFDRNDKMLLNSFAGKVI